MDGFIVVWIDVIHLWMLCPFGHLVTKMVTILGFIFFFNLMLEYLIMYGVSNMIECFKIMLRHSIWCIYFG